MSGTAARRWAEQLAGWGIPEQILAQAPRSPWIHPVEQFAVTGEPVPGSPSDDRAREALEPGSAVLDLGCGGGRAAFALTPPATAVIGVDRQPEMLEAFARAAERRGVRHAEVLGDWPQVADRVATAEVVVAHHVAYNVSDLASFARAATAHAGLRVVLELPDHHPLAPMAPLWWHFWHLERPDGPTADDALAVLHEAGIPARLQAWPEQRIRTAGMPWARQVEFARVRLCLPAERDAEVSRVLADLGPPAARVMVTIWWDAPLPLRNRHDEVLRGGR
jgi:SAM-dependent methyltransferase